jgi:GNAT superfamily N-acetyltransferase
MGISVTLYDDPASVLNTAREFLASKPVLHNMILTLLSTRVAHPEFGRYWVAAEDSNIVGVVFQSPLTIAATLTPMAPGVVAAMVDAIADSGVPLPGVNGEAATAASFAGHWTERRKSAALPSQGMRIYELSKLAEGGAIAGKLRKAISSDRNLMVAWVGAFHAEVGQPIGDPEAFVDRWLSAGQLWLWDHEETVSMAVTRDPAAGVVRVSGVYTPPEHRKHGYAEACVHALSTWLRHEGYRCMLYTDLASPTSNSIYRRIGYRAVAEVLCYRFHPRTNSAINSNK